MDAPDCTLQLVIRDAAGHVVTTANKHVRFHDGAQKALDGGEWSKESKVFAMRKAVAELAREADHTLERL